MIKICMVDWLRLCFESIVDVLSAWLALLAMGGVPVFVTEKGSEVLLHFDLILPLLEGRNGINFVSRHNGVRSCLIDPLLYKLIILPCT